MSNNCSCICLLIGPFLSAADRPQILVQPQDAPAVPPKGDAVFTIEVIGTEPLTFSWEFKLSGHTKWHALLGVGRIMGTDGDKLVIGQVKKLDEGQYRCVVSNNAGTTVSEVANFTLGMCILVLRLLLVSTVQD